MYYADALVSQLFMLDRWQRDSSESRQIARHDEILTQRGLASPFQSAKVLQNNFVTMLSQADAYYISKEIADVLVDGFDTLPNSPLGDVWPKSRYGWALFEQPLITPLNPASMPWYIQALAWGPVPEGNAYSDDSLNIFLFIRGTDHRQSRWDMRCCSMTLWGSETGWDHFKPEVCGPDQVTAEWAYWNSKLTFSFFAFIRQECVSIQNQMASRPIRRHLPQGYTAKPAIRIIQLRRRNAPTNGKESQSRDYACRWLVKGHWRNQFYARSNTHRPLFVPAYVKGPDDKPFKHPKSSIFAVVR